MPSADDRIIYHFNRMGRALAGDYGQVPVTWQEVQCYSNMTKADLNAWEANMLYSMSTLYCNWIAKGGKSISEKSPYQRVLSVDEQIALDREIMSNIFGG